MDKPELEMLVNVEFEQPSSGLHSARDDKQRTCAAHTTTATGHATHSELQRYIVNGVGFRAADENSMDDRTQQRLLTPRPLNSKLEAAQTLGDQNEATDRDGEEIHALLTSTTRLDPHRGLEIARSPG